MIEYLCNTGNVDWKLNLERRKGVFEVRVFNPNARRYAKQELSKTYQRNEKEKKHLYNERIMQVEHGTFTRLVMSATGGMGRESSKVYSPLSELISEKRKSSYNIVATWYDKKLYLH